MKNWKSVFWGILLIFVGILFLGNNLEWWNINIFFDGWWSLFIIVPSLLSLFKKGERATAVCSLSIGVLLLLAAQDIINWNMIWKIFIPIVIIVIGLTLIFGVKKPKMSKANSKEYVAIFSGVDEKIIEIVSDFSITAVFGGVELDLRKAKIKKDLVIEATSIFGGIDLKLPDNVKLKLNGVPIFGGVDNRYDETIDSGVTIYINYTCLFGGIDIL